MKRAVFFLFCATSAFMLGADTSRGIYLGQAEPGIEPTMFAPGLISTSGVRERSLALSPRGDEIFFIRGQGWPYSRIMRMRQTDGGWTTPELADFSRGFWATEPAFSPDGEYLYFSSSRGKEDITYYSLWRVRRQPGGWSEPESVVDIGGGGMMEFHPTITEDGTLYFCYWDYSRQVGDICLSRLVNGVFLKPVRVDEPISTRFNEADPYVDPKGRFLLFKSDRPGGFGGNDVYISRKLVDGTWGEPVNLGPDWNTPGDDDTGDLSPDGKFLSFMRNGDIYWASAEFLEYYP